MNNEQQKKYDVELLDVLVKRGYTKKQALEIIKLISSVHPSSSNDVDK